VSVYIDAGIRGLWRLVSPSDGDEMHFGLGTRDGKLITSATHAGAIPVTPENTKTSST